MFNLNRENVLNALVHPEDFYANQTRVIPVFRDPSNTTPVGQFGTQVTTVTSCPSRTQRMQCS